MSDFKSFEAQICEQEEKVRQEIARLNQLHQSRPAEVVKDYEFKNLVRTVKLSELFGQNEELIVIHNMGKHCSYCTLWADGFNGYYQQIPRRASFVVVNNDSPDEQYQFATSRKWTFPMYSSRDTGFFGDMGFSETKEGKLFYWPGVSIFRKTKDGKIERTTRAGFGPGDLFSSIWHLFELLPKGVDTWKPANAPLVEPKGHTQINGFNVVAVYSENPEVSAQFYKDVLGFENASNMADGGILLRNKNAEMTMYLGKDHKPQVSLCFNSQLGVMKSAEVLKTKGIPIVNQYGSVEAGFAGVQFKDPSGNLLEIAGAP